MGALWEDVRGLRLKLLDVLRMLDNNTSTRAHDPNGTGAVVNRRKPSDSLARRLLAEGALTPDLKCVA